MTAYLLALGSAALYGAADFLGGTASRRASTFAVVVLSQLAGLVLLLVLLPLLPGSAAPATSDLTWGAVAGVAGGTGVALLYRALAIGTMAVVAPTTAVCAVAIPVMVALAAGERPGVLAVAGIVLAAIAIGLVSQADAEERDPPFRGSDRLVPSGLGLALAAGVAIGLFFVALARTDAAAGMWPLVGARVASVALFAALGIAASRSFAMSRAGLVVVIAAGMLDMLANALYLVASRIGPLSTVVTLASLYPASTVMLARFVLGERLSRLQWAGVGCALIAVVLIVAPPVQ
jgi:drug/metabolite transporter (DMT)-like permease